MGLPLRILHVAVNMNRGGAEMLIMNLYRNIDRSKVQFDFLTCREGSFDTEICKMGGEIHRIPYMTDGGHFRYIKALTDFFHAHPEYQVVHSHMDRMSGFVLHSAKKAGIPIRISHSHSTVSEGGIAAKGYKWYAGHFILRDASLLFACSGKAAKWLYGNKSNQATILKNGVDCDQFKYSPKTREKVKEDLNFNGDQLVVGHVGRFCHQKNHTFLIDTFSKIVILNPNAILVLVGDGPLKSDIGDQAKRMGLLDKIRFLGVRSDVHEVMQAVDIMLFPSIHEGLPVTLIEAQATGLPCMISNTISDEVDMGAGLIKYESIKSSPQTWAEQALFFAKETKRSSGTSAIQNNGYDISQSAAWLQNFYIQVLEDMGETRGETG